MYAPSLSMTPRQRLAETESHVHRNPWTFDQRS